jgi:hypothetical protein
MLRFSYRAGLPGWEQQRDCTTATKADLLWYFFPGDVDIVGDGVQLTMASGSVPALHFISALLASTAVLDHEGASYEYTLTEADEQIWFKLRSGDIEITCSYATGAIRVPRNEFMEAVKTFSSETLSRLAIEHPDLQRNSFVAGLRSEVESITSR